MSEQSRGGDVILTFLLGAAAGAVAALLLAPRSGKETRRRLQHWLEDLEGKGHDLLEEGRELLEEGKEAVQEKAEKNKRVIETGRRAWDDSRRNE